MHPQARRYLQPAFGLALSLSLASGCGPLRAGILTTTSVPGSPKSQVDASSGGSSFQQSTAPLSFLTITGKATFQGQPLANAELRVVDALTDKAAPVVAAGGANVVSAGGGNVVSAGGGNVVSAGGGNIVAAGGGNIVAAGGGNIVAAGGGNIVAAGGGNIVAAGGGNLRTDAQGNFSIQVSGLTGGNAARLVVAAGGSAVSTLVTGGGGLMGKYTIQQAGGSLQAPINEVTTTISHLANGTLKLSRLLTRQAAGPIINEMLTGLQSNASQFQQEFDRQQGLGNSLVQETDPATGAPKDTKTSVLSVLIGNAGVRKAIFDLNKASLKAIAQAANSPQNQAPDKNKVQEELQGVSMAGTGLTVSLTDSSLMVRTSSGTTVDLSLSDTSKLDAALGSTALDQPASSSSSNSGAPLPGMPTIQAIAQDTGKSTTDFITQSQSFTLSGTADANAQVELFKGGALFKTATADGTGHWSAALTAFAEGQYRFSALVRAANGVGVQSDTKTVVIDLTAPISPVITGLAAGSDTGTTGDLKTNDTTPELTGTTEADATVDIYEGATKIATTNADGVGNWTVTLPMLSEGGHSLTAKATDAAGNIGAAAGATTITIDTQAPVTPVFSGLTTATDSGTVGDLKTRVATPGVYGTAEPGSVVTIGEVDPAAPNGLRTLSTVTANVADGSWGATLPALTDGIHILSVKATDSAGNGSALAGQTITIDTVAPAPTIAAISEDRGISDSDFITSDNTLTISGTTEKFAALQVMVAGQTLTANADAAGAWTVSTAVIPDGSATIQAISTDAAGNTGSVSRSLTIDTAMPIHPTVETISGSTVGGTGYFTTTTKTPTISGTAEAGTKVAVVFTLTGATTQTVTLSAIVEPTGIWSVTNSSPLATGVYSMTVTSTDKAGNSSSGINTIVLTIQ